MIMITDPIGDMLARIRNAVLAGKKQVIVPQSRLREGMARVLEEQGFLEEVKLKGEGKGLVLRIAYVGKQPMISALRQVSKPGKRVYKGARELKRVLGGAGMLVLSTSKGIVSDKEARKRSLGGEVLAEVW